MDLDDEKLRAKFQLEKEMVEQDFLVDELLGHHLVREATTNGYLKANGIKAVMGEHARSDYRKCTDEKAKVLGEVCCFC